MSEDAAVLEQRIKEFIDQVVETGVVWGLTNEEGWASSDSLEGDESAAIAFWSDEATCRACAQEDWAQYKPESISLAEFLENWCIGMYHDYCLAGLNWDIELYGVEVEPLELAIQILDQLDQKGKKLTFENHTDQNELRTQIQDVLDQENS